MEEKSCDNCTYKDSPTITICNSCEDLHYWSARKTEEIDCEGTTSLTCPYCGWKSNDHSDLTDFDDNFQCGRCEKYFSYEREVVAYYTSQKIEDD